MTVALVMSVPVDASVEAFGSVHATSAAPNPPNPSSHERPISSFYREDTQTHLGHADATEAAKLANPRPMEALGAADPDGVAIYRLNRLT